MSLELAVVVVAAVLEMAGLVYIASLVHRSRDKMEADDAALYLQGKRVEEVIREMRVELRVR